ncbi:DUF1254 domain-containing protein [Pseudomonas sp. V1]|uniref:DUF1254 domain-containing protein n=1 Tax=Pseudomonas arcuscaelestis TaxID=2710591 RepID=UPI00193F6890|nr:DUF1254 domain-containing protein [Pseudomonas arcuscaelestis]MBM3103710.1 DUF1254 domain-containing protein [Pseudomonas arcuscaelestis]
MTLLTRLSATWVLAAAVASPLAHAQLNPDEARKLAKDSYIFAYPLVLTYRTLHAQAVKSPGEFGKWLHLGLSSPADSDIVTPSNDTPYSYAWVDLRAEPWVLTLPKIEPDRYYTSQWDDLWGYVVDNPGSLKDGNDGGSYLLAGPDWKGQMPKGIKRVVQGESSILGTLTRTQVVGGVDDLPNAQKIQQEYKLQPLSQFVGKDKPNAAPAIDWPAWKEGDENTEAFWSHAAFLLQFIKPNPVDAPEYAKLKQLGIQPGKAWTPESLPSDVRQAMQQGIKDAQAEFATAANDPKVDSGKLFGDRKRIGTDYMSRTLGVVLGIFGNVKEQAVYYPTPLDDKGQPLNGSKANYTISFPKGGTPPVKFFWSYTMYKMPERLLVENPIHRYSISNKTEGVKPNQDGSLTLYVSHASPGKDKESNWLPAPDGPFWLVLRNYGPDKTVMDHTYKAPLVVAKPLN